MSSFAELKASTQSFFAMHWPPDLWPIPSWSEPWYFKEEIPNQKSRGCYALFDESGHLLYIGIGIGTNGKEGPYTGRGLGARLGRIYRTVGKFVYEPAEKYTEVHHIRTLNFKTSEADYFWLAAALEIYLIQDLKPRDNITYK